MKHFKNNKRKTSAEFEDYSRVIGSNRPFATAEAHKRLRTNVMFSFAEDSDSRVIGITSAMAHEGKTTTSINLAYDLMKAGQKVLLIDADMRMSNIVKILNVEKAPGLSNLLVGRENRINCIQSCAELEGLKIISCGDIPPNPSELLSSRRMVSAIESLREKFDYIIIDLPPVAEVSDALIVSKMIDGIIIVARQDYADKRLMDDTVRQLKFQEANIIGFVMNCTHTENHFYGKYGKYGKYGRYGRYGKYGYYRQPETEQPVEIKGVGETETETNTETENGNDEQ